MRLEQQVATQQVQTTHLSTQMLQSLEILSLPILDLQQKIEHELEMNPALERVAENSDVSLEETFEEFEMLEAEIKETEWADLADFRSADRLSTIIERTGIAEHKTLRDSLIEQLRLHHLGEKEYRCGCIIINNLDENGFHTVDPAVHPELSQFPTILSKLISLIQTFEPWGICVSNVQESLLLQMRLRGDAPAYAHVILQTYFAELKKKQITKIATLLHIPHESVMSAYQYVRGLTPYPGKTVSVQQAQFIVPDLEIRFTEGAYTVAINDHAYPKLRINNMFLEIDAAGDDKHNQFIRSYRQQAQTFMSALKRRNHTLLRTAYALLHKQHQFFRLGPQYLQPLRLQDVASMLKVHETTVSRIASRKYVQTNWGVYPIAYLFSREVNSARTDKFRSKESVKALIKEILTDSVHASRTLSDQKIVERLKTKGIQIARRTVTKYRHELDVPSTFYRRLSAE